MYVHEEDYARIHLLYDCTLSTCPIYTQRHHPTVHHPRPIFSTKGDYVMPFFFLLRNWSVPKSPSINPMTP